MKTANGLPTAPRSKSTTGSTWQNEWLSSDIGHLVSCLRDRVRVRTCAAQSLGAGPSKQHIRCVCRGPRLVSWSYSGRNCLEWVCRPYVVAGRVFDRDSYFGHPDTPSSLRSLGGCG